MAAGRGATPLVLAALAARVLLRGGHAQEVSDVANVEPGYPKPTPPCSCECCLVAERLPSEEVLATGTQTLLTRKCSAPAPAYQTEVCTEKCKPSYDIVLTSSQDDMDYDRYCQYKCRPETKTIGTICEPLSSDATASTFNLDGNGNANVAVFAPLSNEDTSWAPGAGGGGAGGGGGGGGGPSTDKATFNIKQQAANVKEKTVYDMRKVISERLRTEAAANTARAAASEAWARANKERALHATAETSKVEVALQTTAERAGAAQVAAATEAKEATDEAGGARRALAEAAARIPAAVQAEAKKEAEAAAVLYGWDKPPNWDKVLAVTSADPYLQQMTEAVWRASEYNSFARGIIGKAKGAQAKAVALTRQANQYEAMHDMAEAKQLRFQIKGLIGQSKALEAKAKKFWAVADTAQHSVQEWQQAGLLAANYNGWEFHKTFTPPPSLLQVGLRAGRSLPKENEDGPPPPPPLPMVTPEAMG